MAQETGRRTPDDPNNLPVDYSEYEMPEEDRAKLRFLAHAAMARNELLAYNTFIDPTYQIYPGLELLIAHLEAVERGDIKRLIITMPPRHGKSETTSGKFPGWCIGRDPTRTVIMTSYSATLAETFSIQNRDTIKSNPRWHYVFPNVSLDPNKQGKDKWAVGGRRESMLAAGVGGAITGFGAWLLLIDDPIKNAEEANSPAYQEKVYQWYRTTSRTRLTNDGRIVIIMTRWSEDDLVGKILASEEGDSFTVIHLPALSYGTEEELRATCISDEEYAKKVGQLPKHAFPDQLGRPKDAPLWEDRFNYEFLCDARIAMRHDFEALYQGNPSAPEGQKFKKGWFRGLTPTTLHQLPIKAVAQAVSFDLAWSSKTSADWTVALKGTLYQTRPVRDNEEGILTEEELLKRYNLQLPPAFVVLEELTRYQLEWDKSEKEIERLLIKYTHNTDVLMEAVASQNLAVKAIKKKTVFWRHTIIPVVPSRDKEERAKYTMQLASKGLVFILYPNSSTPPDWEAEFLKEIGAFPNSAKDDQVDALTQLINYWADRLDKLLINLVRQTWTTPFMHGATSGNTSLRKDLPPEFREDRPTNARDKLSWV